MSADRYKIATNNNPDIIFTLVADGYRAQQVWGNTLNESLYLSHPSKPTVEGLPEIRPSPETCLREVTPSPDDPGLHPVCEPAVQFTFGKPPKNPELGFLLGSEKEVCDMFLGSLDDCISHRMLSISFNDNNEVIMKTFSRNETKVSYGINGTQEATRKTFTWVFPPEVDRILVNVARRIQFWVVVPTHETDREAYDANSRDFKKLADDSNYILNLLDVPSGPETMLASEEATPHSMAEPAFYLRTAQIGKGSFGVVYRGRSMPNGGIVALKDFKTRNAWTLEADVLQKLSKTPHDNIVEFIDFGLGDMPYLVMGLAPGGNLEEQHRIKPFTIREVGLILRQMLDALIFLHVDFGITHRDIKPANILCDSRAHFRLADFGLAKEGDALETFQGTEPYMAPEMFANEPYTAAVDVWALGMVIARFLPCGSPPGYNGFEGSTWCAAFVAHFKKYGETVQVVGSDVPEHIDLKLLVGQHMLRMKPEHRESAIGCLDQGSSLWGILDHDSVNSAKTPTWEDPPGIFHETPRANSDIARPKDNVLVEKSGLHNNGALKGKNVTEGESAPEREKNQPSRENKALGDNGSRTETESSNGQSLSSWESLERRFPCNEANGERKEGRFSASQHFLHSSSPDLPENGPE